MANIQKRVLEKELHPNARHTIENYTFQFTDALVIQSKTLATLGSADEVQSIHVEQARNIVLSASHYKSRARDALLLTGSLLLGAAIQGVINEYSTTQRPSWFVFYFAIGVLGTILGIWGIFKK